MVKTFFTLEPCTSAKAYEIKFDTPVDLKKAEKAFAKKYEILASSEVMLMININEHAITLYASGRAMVKYVDRKKAQEIGKKIADLL